MCASEATVQLLCFLYMLKTPFVAQSEAYMQRVICTIQTNAQSQHTRLDTGFLQNPKPYICISSTGPARQPGTSRKSACTSMAAGTTPAVSGDHLSCKRYCRQGLGFRTDPKYNSCSRRPKKLRTHSLNPKPGTLNPALHPSRSF